MMASRPSAILRSLTGSGTTGSDRVRRSRPHCRPGRLAPLGPRPEARCELADCAADGCDHGGWGGWGGWAVGAGTDIGRAGVRPGCRPSAMSYEGIHGNTREYAECTISTWSPEAGGRTPWGAPGGLAGGRPVHDLTGPG